MMNSRRAAAVALIAAGLAMFLVLGPLAFGVWVPDIVMGKRRTIAEQTFPDGRVFRVEQYWNGVDFYTTEFVLTGPGEERFASQLDGDDRKSWRVPMTVNVEERTAAVTLRGGRTKVVYW